MTENKWLSRKFLITTTLVVMFLILRWFDKIEDLYFTIAALLLPMFYLYVNSTIEIKSLDVNIGGVSFKGKKRPHQEDDGGY